MTATQSRTLVEIEPKSDKIGSLYIVEDKSKERATALDPIKGTVVGGEHDGQMAYFHKNTYKMALRGQDKALFEEGGKTFLTIQDNDIFLYTSPCASVTEYGGGKFTVNRDDVRIEMKPEWILCEPPDDTWETIVEGGNLFMAQKTASGLYIGRSDKPSENTMIAKISHINPLTSEEFGIFVGDKVYLDKATDIPLESEINRTLDAKYFRVNIENIFGKCLD